MKNRKLLTLGLACLGVALLAYELVHPRPAPLPPVSLLAPNQIPPQHTPLFARIVPVTPRWAWAWRLREKVVGQSKSVILDIAALRMGALCGTNLSSLPAPDLVAADGLQVWRLGATGVEALRQQFKAAPDAEFLHRSRITTGEDSAGSIYNGNSIPFRGSRTDVGLFVTFLPKLRGEVTDVIASVKWLEALTNRTSEAGVSGAVESISLQTNLEANARLQLSNGCGALLLQPASGTGDTRRVGMLLWVTRPETKRPSR